MGAEADADEQTPSVEDLRDRLDGDVTSVLRLNNDISTLIDDADLHFDYVVGDCSDRYEANSGHLHFDLVHDDCTIHCLVLSYRRDSLTDAPAEDAHIAVKGDLSYYEAEGGMTIFVSDIVEVGDGHYEAIYRENRETLEADGLLADEAKQSLPEYPATVGIATSGESDAREDAVQSIHERNRRYCHSRLYRAGGQRTPVAVRGD